MVFFHIGLNLSPHFPLLGQCVDVVLINPHKIIAPFFGIPLEGSLNRRSGHPGALYQIKSHSHNGMLHCVIPGLAAGIAEWKIAEKKSRNPAFFDNIPRAADNNRGDVIFLKIPGYQTHGLMAYRSKRREDYGINTILAAPF